MRAGYFDPLEDQPCAAIPPEAVGSGASHELAKESALQGMVLLRNEAVGGAGGAKALPLRKGKLTAVLGPLANATLALASRYYDAVCPGLMNASLPFGHGERASGCIRSPLAQLAARGHIIHEPGIPCADDHPANHCVGNNSTASFAAAIKAAQQADQIVFFVGLDHTQETEGTDRQQLSLPGAQQPLLVAVRKAAPPGKPITVVLLNGGAVSMDSLAPPASDPVADALVEAFFPVRTIGSISFNLPQLQYCLSLIEHAKKSALPGNQ